jgi:hypothetical protein
VPTNRTAVLRALWRWVRGAKEATPGGVNAAKLLFELLPLDLAPECEPSLASIPRGIRIHAEPLPRAELLTEPEREPGPEDEPDPTLERYQAEERARYGDVRAAERKRNAHGTFQGPNYVPPPGPRLIGEEIDAVLRPDAASLSTDNDAAGETDDA